MADIEEEVLQDLYTWIDHIPLSRPKKSVTRDFSDGVLMAEVIRHYYPKFIDLHNYPTCNAFDQKKKNWLLLNWKAFKKLNFELSNDVIESIINNKPGTIERVLLLLRAKMDANMNERKQKQLSDTTPSDIFQVQHQELKRSPRHEGNIVTSHRGMKKTNSLQHLNHADLIPRIIYEEKVQECLTKDETIEILHAKIRRLEHLLHLKDVRVDDLQARLEELRPTAVHQPAPGGPMPKRLPIQRSK